jgi:hypothetical protein
VLSRVIGIAAVVLLSTGGLPATTFVDDQGHTSSLRARVTMRDGTFRTESLQGVGCVRAMCSRVRARAAHESIWLDELLSIREISQNSEGPVRAVFTFKDGSSKETAVNALNRVLYVGSRLWSRQIDLAGVSRIDFE